MSLDWRRSRAYRLWRVFIIRRDKVCTNCGRRQRREAHHIQNAAHHPDLRFDTNNGVTLCKRCHWMLHNLIKRNYRYKTTEKDLKILTGLTAMTDRLPELPADNRNGKIIK